VVDAVAAMSTGLSKTLALLAGVALVVVAAGDAVSTLVTTRRRSGRLWPTYVFYRRTWRATRALGRRVGDERRREQFLATYGRLSLLSLLLVWVLLLVLGWGLVWWALRAQLDGVDGYLDAVYFAGVGSFTVGYGDIVPRGDLARLLAVAQAFVGMGTIALVIGYLPTLFGAYSRREVQLLTLDDLSEQRTTAAGLVQATCAAGGLDALAAAFADWERWCADVFDSHTSYPMLVLFRSRQPRQHWLSALEVVTEAAAFTLAAIQSGQAVAAWRLYRRATWLLRTLAVAPAVGRRAATGRAEDQLGTKRRFGPSTSGWPGMARPCAPTIRPWRRCSGCARRTRRTCTP
jgi:Ion channel